ncbi:DnaB domain protein helicase domain protein [Caldicellulosiruptor kronotskyensis 2002]|uniref:DnaB domain protein helicase domain protein n=1 Tax=Caldicellulosiruptor kronotskyensis (strain DSM 18902 / VKM B-2412 / 2002) TaxID=632348 RepID=E4SB08_CALK2|nr:CHC2 zinc finger domain-containing protein [Caldicellulosiruptor kronotskyensis]ADQ45663.1 DnaB domain protein helicase domain protein [Caldicellulosiruptor kronotskyensis 2002]
MQMQEIVKEIKSKIDIIDYIGRYLQLEKEGSSYKALCPFHPDKNPSFYIKPSEQFFHCFGCGVGGDVITFAMKYYNVDFKEAVKMLAEEIGLSTGSKQTEENTQEEKLSIDQIIAYVETCHQYASLTSYFADRGIPTSLIDKYKMGFDVENNAIVLPIFQDGQIISYVRRNLDDNKPRYEFPKGSNAIPFNVDLLKDDQQRNVFIAEGIFDALTIEAAIGQPAIALNGCENQKEFLQVLNLIKPKSKKFYILFDNDEAGSKAAKQLFDKMKNQYEVAICRWEGAPYKDINEFLQNSQDECIKFLKWQLKAAFYPYALINFAAQYVDFLKSDKFKAISTGFKQLDDVLNGGFVAGNLYVFGAKPSVGKTTFLLQLIDNFLQQGYECVFLSAEMPKEEILTRIFCREYGLKKVNVKVAGFDFYRKLRTRTATQEEMQEFMSVMQDYIMRYAFKLHILEGQRLDEVYYVLDRLQKPILFVDYLQLLQPAKPYQSDKQRVDLIMQELFEIKNKFLIPVVAISSLNRESYDDDDIKAFKESGSIEYGTAAAFLMKRDDDKPIHDDYKGNGYTIKFNCVKNRYGSIGENITMRFWGGIYLFEEIDNNDNSL